MGVAMRKQASSRSGTVGRVRAWTVAVTVGGLLVGGVLTAAPVDAGDGGSLEFQQWWEPELPEGELRALMDQFEEENGITVELLSGPYASTKEQIIAGAATGTIPCVVGLDGAWINELSGFGSIADLSALMSDAGYDDSQIVSQVQIDGTTYMIPVVNFIYPMFTNDDLLEEAGVAEAPTTRTEFADAATAVAGLGENASGWVLPLSLDTPNGVQNDVMAWVWASGGSMLTDDGQPDLTNDSVRSAIEYIKALWDAGVIAPGSFTMKEQDKVEEFTNGRVGMMIDSLAHVNLIRENNPDLTFSITAVPAEDDYTGERGIPYASWGIGISENCGNKEDAWKLVEFLMSTDVNATLSSLSFGFPGAVDAVPDFVEGDEIFQAAFDMYQDVNPTNEFVGLPVAEELMRSFDEELQSLLNGDQTVDEMLEAAQERWLEEF
jgi:multiple sugar transport system substrate-binding protein